jgi:hypothetical protein
MKIVNYLFLAAVLTFSLNCSSAPTNVQVNVNAPQASSANSQASAQTTPAAQQPAAAPDSVVKDLYAQHDKKDSPFFQTKNRALVDKYFDKTLADLIWKDANNSSGEGGTLNADPLYDAQDTEIKNFSVGQPKIENGKAKLDVAFENFGKKHTIVYDLVQQNSAWKIRDINYGKNGTLLEMLQDASKSGAKTADNNFEGNYQVGDTTCTVKPVKMAFEVKWAKGSGTEMFFSEGEANDKFIFASRVKEGEKSNVFSFDDETYSTGIFYRGDGKEFAVKRIK